MQPFILAEAKMKEIEQTIGYTFKDKELLKEALTHTSHSNESRKSRIKSRSKITKDNERLEFLGDSVLNLSITTFLFNQKKSLTEGELSRMRSTIFCEKSLRMAADSFGLHKYILLGKGEELTGGRNRNSIIADAMEALMGAIYLDAGFAEADRFILKYMGEVIELAIDGKLFKDYKTQYQELVQKSSEVKIEYKVLEEKGPDHNKTFVVGLYLNGKEISTGEGSNKKEAEQNAAREALSFEK